MFNMVTGEFQGFLTSILLLMRSFVVRKLLKMNSALKNMFYVTSLNKGCRAKHSEGGVLLGEILVMLNRFVCLLKLGNTDFSCADYM